MHIMIDLETMGTSPTAPIISIGAVLFDAQGIQERFYEVIDLKSTVDAGAVMDPRTVIWWMEQSDEARSALTGEGRRIDAVLSDFYQFCAVGQMREIFDSWDDKPTTPVPELLGVWGNGAAFDNVILAEAYKRVERSAPWPFWKDKCYRTIKGMYPNVEIKRAGTHHNALSDAETQAEHLIRINEAAGGIIL